jgi:HlyD family secretion protein
VAFEVERRSGVLLVPNAALRFQPPPEALAAAVEPEPAAPGSGRERVIWTVGAGGRLEPRRVRIGVSDGRTTELTGNGVEPGLEVVTGVVGGEPAPGRGTPRFGRFL